MNILSVGVSCWYFGHEARNLKSYWLFIKWWNGGWTDFWLRCSKDKTLLCVDVNSVRFIVIWLHIFTSTLEGRFPHLCLSICWTLVLLVVCSHIDHMPASGWTLLGVWWVLAGSLNGLESLGTAFALVYWVVSHERSSQNSNLLSSTLSFLLCWLSFNLHKAELTSSRSTFVFVMCGLSVCTITERLSKCCVALLVWKWKWSWDDWRIVHSN